MARTLRPQGIEHAENEEATGNGVPFDLSNHSISSVRWLSNEEARALFDQRVQEALGISGDEFLRRWDAGDYDQLIDDPEHPEILRLAMMKSFGR